MRNEEEGRKEGRKGVSFQEIHQLIRSDINIINYGKSRSEDVYFMDICHDILSGEITG